MNGRKIIVQGWIRDYTGLHHYSIITISLIAKDKLDLMTINFTFIAIVYSPSTPSDMYSSCQGLNFHPQIIK